MRNTDFNRVEPAEPPCAHRDTLHKFCLAPTYRLEFALDLTPQFFELGRILARDDDARGS